MGHERLQVGDEVMRSDGTGPSWLVVAIDADGWATVRAGILVSAIDPSWPPAPLVPPAKWGTWRHVGSRYRIACEPRWARDIREQAAEAARRGVGTVVDNGAAIP